MKIWDIVEQIFEYTRDLETRQRFYRKEFVLVRNDDRYTPNIYVRENQEEDIPCYENDRYYASAAERARNPQWKLMKAINEWRKLQATKICLNVNTGRRVTRF